MLKSLAAVGLVALTCAACVSGSDMGGPGMGGPERGPDGPPPPMGPQLFVSPFGEPYQSQPGEPYPVAAWFATVDTDGDGKVTKAEFMADGDRFFAALDANSDGVIGQGEIVAYEAMTARLFAGRNGPGGGMPGPGMGGPGGGRPPGGGGLGLADDDQEGPMGQDGDGPRSGPRGPMVATSALAMAGLLNVPQPVKAADVDVNQRITPQEWTQAGDRWFRLLDTNRDGFLTLAELPQTRMQRNGTSR